MYKLVFSKIPIHKIPRKKNQIIRIFGEKTFGTSIITPPPFFVFIPAGEIRSDLKQQYLSFSGLKKFISSNSQSHVSLKQKCSWDQDRALACVVDLSC